MQGKLFVLEGIGGAGKTTMLNRLKKKLGEKRFVFLNNPGSEVLGTELRKILLGSNKVFPRSQMYLFIAARCQLYDKVIEQALLAGKHVIVDRYYFSTIVYHDFYDCLSSHEIRDHFELLTKDEVKPHLIIMDISVETSIKRLTERGKPPKIYESVAMMQTIRDNYAMLDFAPLFETRTIVNADKSEKEVESELIGIIKGVIK